MLNRMRNGDYDALCAASRTGVTALELFRLNYRCSRQPGKKVAGIFGRLKRLERRGLLRVIVAGSQADTRFALTEAGRAAGRAEHVRRTAFDRPTYPRLAT